MRKELTFDEIKAWGDGRDFGTETLKTKTGVIKDRNKYYSSHRQMIEANRKDKRKRGLLKPYWLRLVEFYNLVENE